MPVERWAESVVVVGDWMHGDRRGGDGGAPVDWRPGGNIWARPEVHGVADTDPGGRWFFKSCRGRVEGFVGGFWQAG